MKWLALLPFLCSCSSMAIPETVGVEVGTGIRHEVGEPQIKTNTAVIKALWRFKK